MSNQKKSEMKKVVDKTTECFGKTVKEKDKEKFKTGHPSYFQ